MKVTIEHSDIKSGAHTYFRVRCGIEFNEEEKAIIRERALAKDNVFAFEHGFVNYPIEAENPFSPRILSIGSRLLFLVGLPMTYFAPPLALIAWASSAGLFIYRKNIEHVQSKAGQTSITLAQVLVDGSFTVTTAGTPLNAKEVEAEIRENLEGLKNVLVASAEMPKTRSFEM